MSKKSLSNNYLYNLAYQILIIIIPILLIPYLARTLLADAVGEYSYSFSIVSYFVTFSMLGIVYYGNRQVSLSKDNKEELNNTFWGIFGFKLIISMISLIVYLLIIFFVLDSGFNKTLHLIQMIFIISVLLDISWFFTGIEDFKKILVRNLVVKLTSVIMIFIFVKKPEDLIVYAFIMAGSEILGHLLMWISLAKYDLTFNFNNIKEYKVLEHGKGLFILFLPRAAIQIYTTLNITMLGYFTNNNQVAFYDYANKIVSVLLAIVTSLGIVMLPRISAMQKEDNKEEIKILLDKSLRTMFYIGIPIMFGLMSISKIFVPWFLGDEFNFVSILLLFLPIKMIFIMISNVTGIQYLISHNRNKEFFISSLLGGVASIIINLIFIKQYGALATVFSLIIAEFVVMLSQLIFVQKDFNVFAILIKTWRVFLSGIIMFISIYLIGNIYYDKIVNKILSLIAINTIVVEIFTTFILIGIGALIYLVLIAILREPLNKLFLDKLKGLIKRRG